MRPFAQELFANPASAHGEGRRARRALEDQRERLAALLGAHADEVVFTSGATESNNLALTSLAGDAPGLLDLQPDRAPLRRRADRPPRRARLPPRRAPRRPRGPGRGGGPARPPRGRTRAWSRSCSPTTKPGPSSPSGPASRPSAGTPARLHCDARAGRGQAARRFPRPRRGHAVAVGPQVPRAARRRRPARPPRGPPAAADARRPPAAGPAARHRAGGAGRRPGDRPGVRRPRDGRDRTARFRRMRQALLDALHAAGPVVVNSAPRTACPRRSTSPSPACRPTPCS